MDSWEKAITYKVNVGIQKYNKDKSNKGIIINADVNGAYQILKKDGIYTSYKGFEKVAKLKVA